MKWSNKNHTPLTLYIKVTWRVDLPVASISMVTMAIQIVTAGKQIFRFTSVFKLDDNRKSKFILKET
jgi:hypothetical protein